MQVYQGIARVSPFINLINKTKDWALVQTAASVIKVKMLIVGLVI